MPATLLSTGIHNVDNSYFTYASNDKKKKEKKKGERKRNRTLPSSYTCNWKNGISPISNR